MATHEMTADGESTAQWAIRQPGFLGSIKQLCCCARCGETIPGGPGKKRKVFNMMKSNMHFLCDGCFAELPD
jgi:hypothetical protein